MYIYIYIYIYIYAYIHYTHTNIHTYIHPCIGFRNNLAEAYQNPGSQNVLVWRRGTRGGVVHGDFRGPPVRGPLMISSFSLISIICISIMFVISIISIVVMIMFMIIVIVLLLLLLQCSSLLSHFPIKIRPGYRDSPSET